MNVLIAAAEAVPFVKVGGMGDVIGSLPKSLIRDGVSCRVILPGYGFLDHDRFGLRQCTQFTFPYREERLTATVYQTESEGVPFYFIVAKPYFGDQTTVYSADAEWDVPRFTLFNKLVMELAVWFSREQGWTPELLQVNDWHMGLLPFLLHQARRDGRHPLANTASLVTIHNSAYQGEGGGAYIKDLIEPRRQIDLLDLNLEDNFLAVAVAYATRINTVSPGFARQIVEEPKPTPLEKLLQRKQARFSGILNGLDFQSWDPEQDPCLDRNFHVNNVVQQRIFNKRALQSELGLPVDDGAMLIAMVTRLVPQKGVDLALEALDQLPCDGSWQAVILGTGFEALETQLSAIAAAKPSHVHALLTFNEQRARQIYASCDVFLMPSRFEPCGMGQLMAMRYGALPLVHFTGGLADTVTRFDQDPERATGFGFDTPNAQPLHQTLIDASRLFHDDTATWRRLQQNAMSADFSWQRSAAAYRDLYMQCLN
ncbi:glycogen synthase [Acanthopleuribacter pedis]|uniref:Glycogen synthase n=1 Tax=Acanthopleuribacter pedis TaxID=442870 RepID=A0A8J7U537_9BACT|nr:glycogen synthase [Acanthopleuribacter pedis]MBO1318921.1 glycogen synthase [Acanthopleuribacter pedis]